MPGARAALALRARRANARRLREFIWNARALARAAPELESGPGLLISFVVPVFDAKPRHLDDLLASFRRQAPGLAELILSDDGSTYPATKRWLARHASDDGVTIISGAANRGIAAATNDGIARARATWIGLLDHDDALDPFAADRIARALAARPDCWLLYTDEVITDADLRPRDIFLKPAWDPVLLSGVNYINHLCIYNRERLVDTGGLREGFQGSQDYELLLRYTRDLEPGHVIHLPYPAYLWRRHSASHSLNAMRAATANARRALAERYSPPGRQVPVDPAIAGGLHRVRFDALRTQWPRVAVVIPSRDAPALIRRVLSGLREETHYPDLEIVIVDNGSTDLEVLKFYRATMRGEPRLRVIADPEPFNFSRAVNRGFAATTADLILLLNNDVEIIDRDWLKEMVSCFDYENVGIAGAKLLYPEGTLQHAGVIAGLGGYAGHWFIGQAEGFPGPMGRLWARQTLSVVTGACMLVSRTCYQTAGPFDEVAFPIAYNDVDFCLRATKAGFGVVWTPFARLIHHESASRGSDETPENIERFNRDKAHLRDRHRTDIFDDRAFNPWYSKGESVPYPVQLDHLPPPR